MSVIAQGQTEIMKQYKFYQVMKDSKSTIWQKQLLNDVRVLQTLFSQVGVPQKNFYGENDVVNKSPRRSKIIFILMVQRRQYHFKCM